TGAGVAAAAVDLPEDPRRRRQAEPAPAVFLGDQSRQPAVLRQRIHELVGVAIGLERSPVLAGEALAERAHRGADLAELGRQRELHYAGLRSSSRRAMTSCWISFEPSPISSSGASR